ncbi:unnamed protein product, partial [Symbiodinium sp. CCMP2456]
EDVTAARAATRHTHTMGERKSLSSEIEAHYKMTVARRAQTAELFTAALQAVEAVQDFIRCYRRIWGAEAKVPSDQWLRLLESEDVPGLNSLDPEVWSSESGSYL